MATIVNASLKKWNTKGATEVTNTELLTNVGEWNPEQVFNKKRKEGKGFFHHGVWSNSWMY
jgi:hypothetical protein